MMVVYRIRCAVNGKSEEHKEKIRLAHLGKKRVFSEEWKRNLGLANKGKKRSKDAIEKTRTAILGRKHSKEAKLKMKEVWAKRKQLAISA